MDRMRVVGRWCFDAARQLADEWGKDRVGGLAAEIAFFALLGFFPVLVVLASLLGSADAIVGDDAAVRAEDWLVDQMTKIFGGDNSLDSTVGDLFAGENTSAFTVGAVIALYAASRGFVAVVRGLDVAYDHDSRRGWLSTRLVGLGLTFVTLVVATIVLMLIVVGPLFGTGGDLSSDPGLSSTFATLWTWVRWPTVFVVLIAWAATVYHVAPNHRSPWRTELPGALLASVWWAAVSLGFSTYLDFASSGANAIFGLLGGAISLLFWLYLMAMGLLVGAEVNSIIAVRRGLDLEPGEARTLRQVLRRR